ncbi:MAG: hypothetical protein ABIZ81_00175, partial [Opitutaceae bacterium]
HQFLRIPRSLLRGCLPSRDPSTALTGTLFTVRVSSIQSPEGPILHLEADYVLSDAQENHLFTDSVAANANKHTVRPSWLVKTPGAFDGAQVPVEFDDLGGGTYRGTVGVMQSGGH